MVDILKNEDGRMVVKLSESFVHSICMTTAALAENVILIDVLHSGRKSKRFVLTADEMDTLADAWEMFKHTVQVAKELEQQRIVKLVEDARKRIEELGATAITIQESTVTDWYNIHYIHRDLWNQYVHVKQLDESLTQLINRITRSGLPLKADEVPSAPKTDSYAIAWAGTVPANTTFSNASLPTEDAS